MKKTLITILTLIIITLTSCAMPDDFGADAIPYEEYRTYVIENVTYKVFKPEDINKSLDYIYYDLKVTSSKAEWLVNATVDLRYKTSKNIDSSKTLLDSVYEYAMKDPALDNLSFTPNIRKSNYYEIEELIENPNLEELSCGVFIAYAKFLVKTDGDSFYLNIPVYERILKVNKDSIIDPFTNEYISQERFQETY